MGWGQGQEPRARGPAAMAMPWHSGWLQAVPPCPAPGHQGFGVGSCVHAVTSAHGSEHPECPTSPLDVNASEQPRGRGGSISTTTSPLHGTGTGCSPQGGGGGTACPHPFPAGSVPRCAPRCPLARGCCCCSPRPLPCWEGWGFPGGRCAHRSPSSSGCSPTALLINWLLLLLWEHQKPGAAAPSPACVLTSPWDRHQTRTRS